MQWNIAEKGGEFGGAFLEGGVLAVEHGRREERESRAVNVVREVGGSLVK